MNEPLNVMLQSPADREAEKTRTERAEDVAYTLNHAISCAANDMFIAPTISALFGVQVGCTDPSHIHGSHEPQLKKSLSQAHQSFKPQWNHYCDDPTHEHGSKGLFGRLQHETLSNHVPKPQTQEALSKFNWRLYRSEALHYLKGEIVGDALAVPLTTATQRFFPSAMESIRRFIEPLAGSFFRQGANAAAKRWAAQQGLNADTPEVVVHAQAMYQNEMKHLPQAVVWNLFAFPIGVVAQKMGGHGSSYGRIIRNKSIGALISNTLLLSGRAFAPNIAQQWDAMNSQHIITPLTVLAGQLIDIDPPLPPQPSWTARVERTSEADMTRTS